MASALSLSTLINRAFQYVGKITELYKLDESHGLKHSMEVFGYAKRIYESELKANPFLEEQQEIIFAAAIGHDMCDKKYMNETEGVLNYKSYLSDIMRPENLEIIGKIISTMSYSKVKIYGYPDLGKYQLAYHIVREADLLAAYDIDRCIMYTIHRDKCDYTAALQEAFDLFDYRVFKMRSDKLFKTAYSRKESLRLHRKAQKDVESLKNIILCKDNKDIKSSNA
jgi:HD superfamily phosphodiesterase